MYCQGFSEYAANPLAGVPVPWRPYARSSPVSSGRAVRVRTRTTTLEMPALDPPPLVLVRRRRWVRVVALEAVFLVALFAAFAITHRLRAHAAGDTECCAAATAKAR